MIINSFLFCNQVRKSRVNICYTIHFLRSIPEGDFFIPVLDYWKKSCRFVSAQKIYA